ncbi:DNA gyrase subunit B [Streptomyces sp. NPDC049040]|uniref:DNA gyrase subunit B n=1 Tax=Streptomyces sp. NPDC049040 TaxID=3365593 RepID=UPI00371E30A2
MGEDATRYDAADITVLEGWEAIRKRPGMYIGSVAERGLHQAVFQVLDWSVNEVLAGRATSVDVTLTPDGGVRVADDGAGVPIEAAGDTESPGLEALLTSMHTRAEANGRNCAIISGFGIGPFVTNALSSRLTAEVRRKGTRWVQQYTRGVADTPPSAVGPVDGSGTTITFWPDPGIFETVACSFTVLAERFRELAFLNRRLAISLTDARTPGEFQSLRFRSPGGARDFVAFLDVSGGGSVYPDIINFEWEDQRMAGTAEVALRWRATRDERVRGFANSLTTSYESTHMAGFREGVAAAITAYGRGHRLLTASDPDLSADRIGEGLTAVVSVKLDFPEFEGATRGTLGNAAVRSCVAQAVQDHLGTWLETHPREAATIIDRIASAGHRS